MDATIKVMAEASQYTSEDALNSFYAHFGEILRANIERNFSGFLVRKDAIPFKLNSQKSLAWMVFLKAQLVIAKFVGHKPSLQGLEAWLQDLNLELTGSCLLVCRNVEKGYLLLLESNEKDAIHNTIMLFPHKSKWGTCMLQSWVPGFNPK